MFYRCDHCSKYQFKNGRPTKRPKIACSFRCRIAEAMGTRRRPERWSAAKTCRCSADQKLRLRAIFNTQYKGLLLIYSISLSRIESCLTTYWTSRQMEVSKQRHNPEAVVLPFKAARHKRKKNKENNTQRYSSWPNLRPVMLYCCVVGRAAGRGTGSAKQE